MQAENLPPRVVIEGIDGSGKSFAAKAAALALSAVYPEKGLKVIDSDGVTSYRRGVLGEQRYQRLERLAHPERGGKLGSLACIGAFTLLRRRLDNAKSTRRNSDLLIYVRDPQRIDPAVYAPVLGVPLIGKLAAADRLRFFNRLAGAPHPDLIVDIKAEPALAARHIQQQGRGRTYGHEEPAALAGVAAELEAVLGSYTRLFARPVSPVDGLRPDTVGVLAAALEPYLDSPSPSPV